MDSNDNQETRGSGHTAGSRQFRNHYDLAYASVRSALLNGEYREGQKLPLRQIAASLGLSVTPVRDALARLGAEGVLVFAPYRSARVPTLTADEIREIWLIRELLEGEAAKQAALRMSPDDISTLETLEQALEVARADGAPDRIASLNTNFHLTLYRGARLPRLYQQIERQWLAAAPLFRRFADSGGASHSDGRVYHRRILEALRGGDGEQCGSLTVGDIRAGLAKILAVRQA